MKTILDPIEEDPRHPRPRMHWHRVPRWLRWPCIVAATFMFAFDESKVFYTKDGHCIGQIYDCGFYRLMFLERSGNWYFKAF